MKKLFMLPFMIFLFVIMAAPGMAKTGPGISTDIVIQAVDRLVVDVTTFDYTYKIHTGPPIHKRLTDNPAARITPTFHVGKINYS